MASDDSQDRSPADDPAETPAEPVPGAEKTPLAEDLPPDLPVAEPVEPKAVPVAEPVRIPVAEEVTPPKPKRKARTSPKSEPKARPMKATTTKRPTTKGPSSEKAEPPAGGEPPSDEAQPPHRRRRRRILLFVAATAIGLLVAFTPTILSIGPVRRYVLDAANARLPFRVEAEGWALSWFGRQVVRGLSVRMPDGARVATVKQASLDEGLFSVLADRSRLGAIHVEGAEVWPRGLKQAAEAFSAAEPMAAPSLPEPRAPRPEAPEPPVRPPSRPAPEPPAAPALALAAPALVVPDAVTLKDLVVHAGAATVRMTEARFEKGKEQDLFKADLQIRHGEASGTASLEVKLTGLSSEWRGIQALGAEGIVRCTNLSVAAVWATAAELGVPIEGDGALTVKAAFSRARNGDLAFNVTTFTARDLSLAGEFLNGDTPALDSLELTADAAYAGGLITVNALALTAPVATMQASGTFALAATDAAPATGAGSATLTLQVGRIARMLPRTLALHKDLTVEAGVFEATVQAASDERTSRLKFDALLKDVRGTRSGQPVIMSPVRVAADLQRDHSRAAAEPPSAPGDWLALAESLRVNELTASATAGTITAGGQLEAFTLDVHLDLAKATEEVGRFVDLGGYGAEGAAVIHVKTDGTLRSGVKMTLGSDLENLVLHFAGGGRLSEPRATLTASGRAALDDQHRLSDIALDALELKATTASLTAKGFAQRTTRSWQFNAAANGTGTIANLGGLATIIIPLAAAAEPPQKDAEESGPDWRETLLEYARRASGGGGKPAAGRWQLDVETGGTLDQAVAVKADAAVTDLLWPLPETPAKPLRIASSTLHADVLYHPGRAAKVTVHSIEATFPGLSATVEGPATLELEGFGTLDNPLNAVAQANLPTLTQTLAPLNLLPEGTAYAGDVKVRLTALPGIDRRTIAKVKLTVVGEKFEMAWPDGRGFSDPLPRFSAEANLLRDAGDAASEPPAGLANAPDALDAIEVTDWSLATVAGSLKGTAGIARTKTGRRWHVTAAGDGAIRPLAQAIARLQGHPAGPLHGLWNLKAAYDSRTRGLTATASATNLTLPQEGDEPKPDLHLDDIHLRTTAAIAEDGLLRIDAADLTGPGITLKARGAVRLPSDDAGAEADGAVTAKADLARFAQVLAPFGMLPEGVRLAGTADFDGEVASGADGFSGRGVLDLADLEAEAPESRTFLREKEAHASIAFAYEQSKRRWTIASTDMKAETAAGAWHAAVTRTDADPLLEAACDLTFDGQRVRTVLGDRLPAAVRLAGPWRLVADVAGPLPDDGPWHRRIAGLKGKGRLDVKRFQYETLAGGDGTVYWDVGDGQIRFSPDAAKPSRLSLVGGTVNLGGLIDLAGETPRLIIRRRLRAVENVPLGGREIQEYFKYASPVLAASVSAKGNLSVALDSLVVPLADDPNEKDLPEEQKTPVAKRVTATGEYWIDDFQTELMGPFGELLKATGQHNQTIVHPFGPVKVTMQRGILRIEEHSLRYAEGVSLRFSGTIDVDKRMDVIVGVPVTPEMLAPFKIPASVISSLKNKERVIPVPLTGTIDRPRLDVQAFAKGLEAFAADIAIDLLKDQTLERLGDWLKGTLKKK